MSKYTKPHWQNSILITIDTQNDFTLPGAPAEIKGTMEILPKMKQLLTVYRKKGLPILHVVRLYKEDGSNAEIFRREAIANGARIVTPHSEGAELVRELWPPSYKGLDDNKLLKGEFQLIGEKEWVMFKPRWGAFYQTDLENFLHQNEIDTLVFTGCNYPNCTRSSIYEASERDFRIVMIHDAISQLYPKGIEEIKNIGVNVLSTIDALKAIQSI
mgnify:CR=1 FL=1